MAAVLAAGVMSGTAMAQSTIFNIPSTDTVGKGQGYVEFDFLPQAPTPATGAIVFVNPRVVIGLPHDAEVGLNFPIFHYADQGSAPANYAYIQPNLKVKVYKDDDMGLAATVGVVANVPMNNRDGQLSWGYVYGNISKKVGKAGPRFTAGPYGVMAKQDDPKAVGFLGTRGGVLLGYEQPITGKVSFVADWFSGQNTLGYFTPGISITLPHSGLLNAGYSIGNDSVGSNAAAPKDRFVFIYYGVTF